MTESVKHVLTRPNKLSLIRMLLLLVFSAIILLNSVTVALPFIGIPFSFGVLFLSSLNVGEIFFGSEKKLLKQILGLATFIVLMVLLGVSLMLVERFTETVSLVGFALIGLAFGFASLFKKRTSTSNVPKQEVQTRKSSNRTLFSLVVLFLTSTAIAFYALGLARTSHGLISVWLTIPKFFFPFFFLSSLFLMILLFLTELNLGLKLSFVALQSFLVHSLFLIVWYPGRNGDPWSHLGEARYIDRVGTFYAYEWLTSQHLFSDIVKYKSQYALVVLFRRMFSLDIYWVHAFFIPLLWSLLAPFFLYKIGELLLAKKSKTFPLLTAVSGSLFTPLVYWGTISVPNSLGFLFLGFSVMLILYGANSGQKRFWFLALLASVAVLFAHPQTGILAFMFLFAAVIVKSKIPGILKTVLLVPLPAIYLYASMRFMGAEFSLTGLLDPSGVQSFQVDIFTLLLVFAFLGMVFSLRGRLVNGKNALMLFVFYVIAAIDYYVAMYGMQNSPVPDRILPLMALLLIPFAALGLLVVSNFLKAGFSRMKSNFFNKVGNPRKAAMSLICVFLSLLSISALLQTYPSKEITEQQPAAYAVDAIRYVDSTAPGRYVVLTDPGIASLASGFLGIDYSWGVGPDTKGQWGVPEWTYWTIKIYSEMGYNPSITLLEQAMLKAQVGVCYVVVWGTHEDGYFDGKIQRISKVLTPQRIFGGGLLYVYNYTSSLNPINGRGPDVKVAYDGGTSTEVRTIFNYFVKSEVAYQTALSGHSSYNITDFPTYWIFDKLSVNDNEAQFDTSSDIDTFIYISGLAPSDHVDVFWKANEHYPRAAWKEDSFKQGWQTHPVYTGTISPSITTDGDILDLTWDFSTFLGEYQYYYYIKNANVSTSDYPYILIRWKSTGPVAFVAVAYTDSLGDQVPIIPYSSASADWTMTVVQMSPGKQIAYITIGLTNLAQREVSGTQSFYVDYVLLCAPE